MDERENLPAVIAAQEVAVSTTQHGSLAGRALAALKKDNDVVYLQAIGAALEQKSLLDNYHQLGRSCYDCRNYEQAMNWYRKAAELGHFLSQLFLAEMYEDGRGIQDAQQAMYWFRKALETMPSSKDAQGGLERLGVDWKK